MSEPNGSPRILCVDDEPHVLEGLERTLFEQFEVATAPSGAAGLELLKTDGPFAVVVSDMRMPEMDGAAFLAHVRKAVPDTVRVLLTGQADLDAAIAAVNEGQIFRFLSKPCAPDVLQQSMQAAAEQYRLVTAEHDLLKHTLGGSVKVLTEALSLASPTAFSRSGLIKNYVKHMASRLGLADVWKYELAAMLCQIGCIALPPGTLDKVYVGQPLSEEEQRLFDAHPETGHRLLANIPRLESVAEMVKRQRDPYPEEPCAEGEIELGAGMLRVALAIDRLVANGISVQAAVDRLQKRRRLANPKLLAALSDFQGQDSTDVVKAVRVSELRTHMVLEQDIRAKDGNMVVGKGGELNSAVLEMLRNVSRGVGIVEPIRVRIPAENGSR